MSWLDRILRRPAPPALTTDAAPGQLPNVLPLANAATGIGGDEDPLNAVYFQLPRLLNRVQVETAVLSCGEAARICYAVPEDAFKAGFTLTDDTPDADPMAEEIKRTDLRNAALLAAKMANQYGEAFLIPIVWEDGQPPTLDAMRRPLDLARVTRIERFELALGGLAREVIVTERQRSLVGPVRIGDPLIYRVTIARAGPILGPVDVHVSRMFKFQGHVPSPKMQIATSLYLPGEAISVLQRTVYALYGWLESGAANRRAQQEVSQKVLRTSAIPAPDAPDSYAAAVYTRWAMLRLGSSLKTTVIDAGNEKAGDPGEQLSRLNFPVAGLKDLDDGALTHLASALGWPKERVAGLQPTGVINSGPSWESSWWSIVDQEREDKLRRPLEQAIGVLYAAAGQLDVDWKLSFNTLGQPGPLETAEIEQKHADTLAAYVDMGAVDPRQIRRSLFGPEAKPPAGIQPATEEESAAPVQIAEVPRDVRADPVYRALAPDAAPMRESTLVALAQDPLPDLTARVRAIVPDIEIEDWPHLTLLYLGDVPVRSMPAIERAVVAHGDEWPETLIPIEIGPLGDDGAIVLHVRAAGLAGPQSRLLRALAPEIRERQYPLFRPHITIGYAPAPLSDEQIAALSAIPVPGTIEAGALVLRRGDADRITIDAEGFVPPKGAQEAAARALEVRASKPPSQRGMTPVGLARARDLANGRPLSRETIRRMKAYFDRHQSDKSGSTWEDQGKGWQAWMGWGGDVGWRWATRLVERWDREE